MLAIIRPQSIKTSAKICVICAICVPIQTQNDDRNICPARSRDRWPAIVETVSSRFIRVRCAGCRWAELSRKSRAVVPFQARLSSITPPPVCGPADQPAKALASAAPHRGRRTHRRSRRSTPGRHQWVGRHGKRQTHDKETGQLLAGQVDTLPKCASCPAAPKRPPLRNSFNSRRRSWSPCSSSPIPIWSEGRGWLRRLPSNGRSW